MMFDKIIDPDFQHDLAGVTKYADLELKFMKYIMDFQCINKGFHVEAGDFTTKMQSGVEEIDINWMHGFVVCFPLQFTQWLNLKEHKLDNNYNDFCIPKEITRSYGSFWESPLYKYTGK